MTRSAQQIPAVLAGAAGSHQGRLLHAWAILTLLVTLPLLFLGAEVTTKKVGMVDAAWPTSPVHLFGVDWQDSSVGYLIEHGHRLAGYTVGSCVIVLVVGLWLWEPRRWVRWLGVAALLGVIVQGLLGGFRVLFNAYAGTELALIHGCFGQLVFSLLASLALCTSPRWRASPETPLTAEAARHLRRGTLLLVGLLVLQLVLGALIRHQDARLAQRLHLLVAFAVVGLAAWTVIRLREHGADRNLGRAGLLLAGLLMLQLALGVEAWMVRFDGLAPGNPGHWLFNRNLARSAHVVVGSLLLATAALLALEVRRRWALAVIGPKHADTGRLEGAA